MISNYEFIKTQIFEVSWAVFRCTELFTQNKLRNEVEAAAVELITDSGTIFETIENEFPRIEKLTALIRLAESVGQIASINANVLYRELDNLTKAIRLEIVDRREKKNITASLEHMFTNSAYSNNLQPTTNSQQQNADSVSSINVAPVIPAHSADLGQAPAGTQYSQKKDEVANSAIQQKEDRQFGSIESLLSAAAQSSQPINREVEVGQPSGNTILSQLIPTSSALRQSQDETSLKQSNPAIDSVIQNPIAPMPNNPAIANVIAKPTATITRAVARPASSASAIQGSWQHVILQKVKELGQTTTKELTASFPEISERTIRFYLQKLVDNGSIDRVGSTGPGAAYRAK